MTGTTKHTPVGRISKNIGRKFASTDTPNKLTFGYLMVNMQRVAAFAVLCFLSTSFAFATSKLNNLTAPFLVNGRPATHSVFNIRVLPSGMTSYEFRYADGRAFHFAHNADGFITTAGTEMFPLVVLDPLNSLRVQSPTTEVMSLQISGNTTRYAVVVSVNNDRFATAASTQPSSVVGNPIRDCFVGWFHLDLLKSTDLASGELLEPLPGNAEGNQQPSQKYTSGRFRDYLSRIVGLITGTSARVSFCTRDMI